MRTQNSRFKSVGGIVGSAASGKDTVAKLFTQNGYSAVSPSDLVREEITLRGQLPSRQLQTKVANEFRAIFGPEYWVERALSAFDEVDEEVILSGIYSPGEGAYIRQKYGGYLIGVVLSAGDDSKIRYSRMMSRANGSRDALTYEEFMAAHARENAGTTPDGVNIAELLSTADYTIHNNDDLASTQDQVLEVIRCIRRQNHG